MDLLDDIKETIAVALPEAEVHILDPQKDKTHLLGLVVDSSFAEQPLFKQHQKVMRALKSHFSSSLHALQLKTFTPEDWALKKHLYPLED